MTSVYEFIRYALTHAKKASASKDGLYPFSYEKIGSDGEWEYLYGTHGVLVTQAVLDERWKNYYATRSNFTREQYLKATKGWVERKVIASDCNGILDNFLGVNSTANGTYVKYSTNKGAISDIDRPWVIGEAVFNGSDTKKTHVGWVCGFTTEGKPLFLQVRGLMHGCVVTTENEFKWGYRGLMTKIFSYEEVIDVAKVLKITSPLMRGDDIKALQVALNALGYNSGTADGICGNDTMGAIDRFCKAHTTALPDKLAVTVTTGGSKYTGNVSKP